MKKRVIALILVLSIVFSGCNSNNQKSMQSTNDNLEKDNRIEKPTANNEPALQEFKSDWFSIKLMNISIQKGALVAYFRLSNLGTSFIENVESPNGRDTVRVLDTLNNGDKVEVAFVDNPVYSIKPKGNSNDDSVDFVAPLKITQLADKFFIRYIANMWLPTPPEWIFDFYLKKEGEKYIVITEEEYYNESSPNVFQIVDNKNEVVETVQLDAGLNKYCESYLGLSCDPDDRWKAKYTLQTESCMYSAYADRNYCYKELGRFTGNINFCNSITNVNLKEQCEVLAKKEINSWSEFYINQTSDIMSDNPECSMGGRFLDECLAIKSILHGPENYGNIEFNENIVKGNEDYCIKLMEEEKDFEQATTCVLALALNEELKATKLIK